MTKATVSILLCLIMVRASAVPITLILSEEVEVADGKLCVYQNEQRSESVKVAKFAPCHHTKTFDD